MTFVGKILVVVILVLSVCVAAFTGGVYAVQTNWKKKFDEGEKTLADVRAQYENEAAALNQELGALTEEKKKVDAEAAQHRGRVLQLEKQIPQLQAENRDRKAELDQMREAYDVVNAELRSRRAEAERMRERNTELHAKIKTLLTEIAGLEDDKFSLERAQLVMSEKHNQVLEKNGLLEKFLAAEGLEFDPHKLEGALPPTPDVDGFVLNTRTGRRDQTQLVEVTLGSDDGFVVGHELHVYRANGRGRYLGKIRLVYVTPDRSVGALEVRAKNGIIQRGDNVAPKL